MFTEKLSQRLIKTPVLVEAKNFLVKLAENQEEVEDAMRLRYEVFNLEQQRGLKSAEEFCIDSDEFDHYCLHIMVMDKWSRRVLGTYRIHFGVVANSAKGFYSSREFDIKGIESISDKCMELGRSCVSPEFRTGSVISLLWKAISELLIRTNFTYMIGCVSLDETDPRIGWALYEYFRKTCSMSGYLTAVPHPEFRFDRPSDKEIEKILADETSLKKYMPPLFRGYMRLGAQICGVPALDRDFGTMDFLMAADTRNLPERYVRHFNYIRKPD